MMSKLESEKRATKKNHADGDVMTLLDEQLETIWKELNKTAVWRTLTSPKTKPEKLKDILKELYREVAWYQPDVIEATINAIGQMPRSVRPKLVQTMLIHQADEFDHGEMALRDYTRLGGTVENVRAVRMSPTAHAVAAYWVMLAHKRDPFAYLGALYMFEGLTPRLSQGVLENLSRMGLHTDAIEFAEFHATEDIKHQNLVKHLIKTVAKEHPEAVPAMLHGIKTFSHVFPIPIFQASYERAGSATS